MSRNVVVWPYDECVPQILMLHFISHMQLYYFIHSLWKIWYCHHDFNMYLLIADNSDFYLDYFPSMHLHWRSLSSLSMFLCVHRILVLLHPMNMKVHRCVSPFYKMISTIFAINECKLMFALNYLYIMHGHLSDTNVMLVVVVVYNLESNKENVQHDVTFSSSSILHKWLIESVDPKFMYMENQLYLTFLNN